jgi:hypothetical protein
MKLPKKQQIILLNTPDDDLLVVFPEYTREELREYKRVLKDTAGMVKEEREKKYVSSLEKELERLKKEIEYKDTELDAFNALATFQPEYQIKSTKNGGKLTATAFLLLGDIHFEENVVSKTINGLNSYNLDIAEFRLNCYFNNAIRLIRITEKDVHIDKVVLCLLGDMISGNIHEELLENCSLRPIHAIERVMDIINAGIRLLKEQFPHLVVACVYGNHDRITKKLHHATASGNSLEFLMYGMLKRLNPNIDFSIAEGSHLYLDAYDYKIRIFHGNQIRYYGGVSGIFTPVYKALSSWDKAKRAKLSIFGHFHQQRNGGNFITNGSVIGYNPFALSIKADFEPPQQKFFLFLSNGMVSMEAPIILEKI